MVFRMPFAESLDSPIEHPPLQQVPENLVPSSIDMPVRDRQVAIIHPNPEQANLTKARLKYEGHRRDVTVSYTPEAFLTLFREGHRPDVILIDDFVDGHRGLAGSALTQALRMEHAFE